MAAFLVPLVQTLAANGLGLLGSAILAKGKQVVEKELGVKIPDHPEELSSKKIVELKELELKHEQFLMELALKEKELELQADAQGQKEVSARWQVDMTSDSWLSKNVRPLTLAYWTIIISLLATGSSLIKVDEAWIELIKISYVTIIGAYFVGRSVQHVTKLRSKHVPSN